MARATERQRKGMTDTPSLCHMQILYSKDGKTQIVHKEGKIAIRIRVIMYLSISVAVNNQQRNAGKTLVESDGVTHSHVTCCGARGHHAPECLDLSIPYFQGT